MLLFVGNHTTIALAFGTFATESKVQLIAGDTIVQGNHIMVDATIGLLVDIHIAHANVLVMRLLHAIEVKGSILTYVSLDDLSS